MAKSQKSTTGTGRKLRQRHPNHLPYHIAQTFQVELDELITRLAQTGGFKESYLRSEYLSKYNDPKGCSPAERRTAAIQKWMAAERINRVTNQRLFIGGHDLGYAKSEKLLRIAASKIKSVLGSLDYPSCLFKGSHSGGASTRVQRSPSSMIEKYAGEAHVSSTCVKHWLQFASNSMLSDQVLTLTESSAMFTVPKATDIDRVACKEPEINMFLQKSIGNHIRRRMRKFGINLNDQSINRGLARTALLDKSATIDLSSASDSITVFLVMRLLPYDWYSLLDDLRVKTTVIDGETHELEMFSSMGNGFTFELESLIFWALAHAIKACSGIRGKVSVYGDDLIIPISLARRLARTFAYFGFRVNRKKSRWTGKFRESCGGHYYDSRDVTPFYLREPVRWKTDVIRLLNRLAYWDAREIGFITDPDVLTFHQKWSMTIPRHLWGGQSFEDITSLVTGHNPRKVLAQEVVDVDVDESARKLCWFTNRRDEAVSFAVSPFIPDPCWVYDLASLPKWAHALGNFGLEYKPVTEGKWVVRSQPVWKWRTTFKPWLLQPMD